MVADNNEVTVIQFSNNMELQLLRRGEFKKAQNLPLQY